MFRLYEPGQEGNTAASGQSRFNRRNLFLLWEGGHARWTLHDAFWLHKFRATFATHCLHSGLDIKTVQYLLGHKAIESTMRYLAPVRNAELRGKVDAVWAAPTMVVDDSEMPEREQVRLQ